MKRLLLSAVLLAGLAWLALGPAIEQVYADETVAVRISPEARLVQEGQAVRVAVKVKCEPVGQLLEALLYVVQDGNTSQFAGVPVVCDNQWHARVITVRAFEGTPFHPGEASASAYILLYNPDTGETWQGQASGPIQIR